jgi:hypothetical protein
VLNGMVGDKGLIVKDKAAHHAISAKFDKPINPKGKPLVVQYEVKLQGLFAGIDIARDMLIAPQTVLSAAAHT